MNLENFGLATEKDSLESERKNISIRDYGTKVTGEWLENALLLDAALTTAAPEVMNIIEQLFPEILEQIESSGIIKKTRTRKNKSRIKYTCKTILFNLYLAYLIDKPVRYSRDATKYVSARRYGKLFFKYTRVIATVDAFKSLDLIHQKGWVNDRKKRFGRQSRMWASGKLISMFKKYTIEEPRQVYSDEPKERIVLRNATKIPVHYKDTDLTISFRENINCYNNFIAGQQVEVLSYDTRKVSLYNLNSKLYLNLLKGNCTLTNLQTNITGNHLCRASNNSTKHKGSVEYTTIRNEYNNNIFNNYISMTHRNFTSQSSMNTIDHQPHNWFMFRRESPTLIGNGQGVFSLNSESLISGRILASDIPRHTSNQLTLLSTIIRQKLFGHKKDEKLIHEKLTLKDFDIAKLNFLINSKKLHRVFNQSSFELGGRFYGAFHQEMPKEFREDILINGEPTVELDYAAHHMRMSYHLEKVDYREDPYLALTDDEKERKTFKNLMFIAFNAETVAKVIKGFRKACIATPKEDRIELSNANILKLMARIYKAHKPIAHYISSGAGLRLQNIDSQITEAILMRMTRQAIPCLPVHDSYIVPARHREVLYQAMVEEYEKVMGFQPVVK